MVDNKSKEIDIKKQTCDSVDDLININDRGFENIMLGEKQYEDISIIFVKKYYTV